MSNTFPFLNNPNGVTIGVVFGCFIPLHSGHLALIDRAFRDNECLIIAVCGKDGDRGKDFIPFRDRIRLVQNKFACNPRVKVVTVDDEKIGMDGTFTLHNWEVWCKELFDNAGIENPDLSFYDITWYTGEQSYIEKLRVVHPKHTFVWMDRSLNTVSGTKIREDVNMYRDQIDPEFQNYLKKKGTLK